MTPGAATQTLGEGVRDNLPLATSRGRLGLRRTTAGRGGRTVTPITGFVGIGLPEREALGQDRRPACGCGGAVTNGAIGIQGDRRDTLARVLAEAGFKPVFAGG